MSFFWKIVKEIKQILNEWKNSEIFQESCNNNSDEFDFPVGLVIEGKVNFFQYIYNTFYVFFK